MKVVQLTAGTGDFHCGNCVRDCALTIGLRDRGHDAVMIPLYLPIVADEHDPAAGSPIFYGGINVYLQQKLPFFRKTPRWLDRWLDSRPLLGWAARKTGMTKAKELGEITLSTLRGEDGNQTKELERLVDWLEEYHRPDVVNLSNALLVGLARRIKERLQVPVVCTLQGEDGFLDGLIQPYGSEAWSVLTERATDIDAWIAVSHYYAKVMRSRLSLPEQRVFAIHNGVSLGGYSGQRKEPAHPTIGYLARMCMDKGLAALIEAFLLLKEWNHVPGLRLKIAGTQTESDLPFVRMLLARIERNGLKNEVEFLPNLSHPQKISFLESISVLSVPATYGEAFGLYVIEALAAGTPVVEPNHAAFPELLEATGGGILYDPFQKDALPLALERLLLDPALARELGNRGRESVLEKFTVDVMAERVERVFQSVRL